jgi:pentose-5-phosphate-3-epimerase/predicted transcriptional regulator
MRISASIYSDKKRDLQAVIADLEAHKVDLLHVDCNDNVSVFDDIRRIREWCSIPIDLHIITPTPEKYYDLLRQTPVEYVTFQLEDLQAPLSVPSDVSGKKGLAITTPTPVDAFDMYASFDFILMMATVPGQSGGVFDASNFKKIRDFQKKYPQKSVHVDGGVNGEVSFILRNMGVHTSVSGSYLFNAPSIGHALMDLTKREVHSQFRVKDFMIPLNESPTIGFSLASFANVLESIETGKLGFTIVLDENNGLSGLISNADVRKALIRHGEQTFQLPVNELMNTKPVVLNENATVNELLTLIRSCPFPILYLPVVNDAGEAQGIVTFVNLIKGEL